MEDSNEERHNKSQKEKMKAMKNGAGRKRKRGSNHTSRATDTGPTGPRKTPKHSLHLTTAPLSTHTATVTAIHSPIRPTRVCTVSKCIGEGGASTTGPPHPRQRVSTQVTIRHHL